MVMKMVFPKENTKSLLSLKNYKKEKMLWLIADKIQKLFEEISYIIYPQISNRTSFVLFINSFYVINENEEEINVFCNEDFLRDSSINDIILSDFERYLKDGEINVKNTSEEDEYINELNRLEGNMRFGLDTYMKKDFWQDFKREER